MTSPESTIEEGRAFYTELKAATLAAGRNADHIKILPGIVPIIGATIPAEQIDLDA